MAKKIGIQGQSWGGYQVSYLITQNDMYAAAWAGAPVVNMTSAYGGIRWSSGINRQFQYEKSQSRIGKTLWEAPELYLENSPLFHLDKATTPVVIMSNDKDGAVPWYQGIEMFTALRRLDKKVWLLNYNNDDHTPQSQNSNPQRVWHCGGGFASRNRTKNERTAGLRQVVKKQCPRLLQCIRGHQLF